MKALGILGIRRLVRHILLEPIALLASSRFCPSPVRRLVLAAAGAKIGTGTIILDVRIINAYRTGFSNLRVGRNSFLGQEVLLDIANPITIGDDVTIAARSAILTHRNVGYPDHPLQGAYPRCDAPVEIEEGSFLGYGTIVLPGARIGREVFVHAGAIVKGGLPARTELKVDSRLTRR